jgi:hypothetical protein
MDKRQIKLDMMAYLYGELSPDEKRRFEDALDADPELRQEWNALREVRNRLSDLADKEVLEPMLLLDRKPSGAFTGFLAPRAYTLLRPVLAIAASLILLMVAGNLTRFSLQRDASGFSLSFNRPATPALTGEQINELVRQEVARSAGALNSRLDATENNFQQKLTSLQTATRPAAKAVPAAGQLTREEVIGLIAEAQAGNLKLVQEYLAATTVEQQAYFRTAVTELSDYLQEQRAQDLLYIGQNLVYLKDYQEQSKQETRQLLASIFTNTNTSNQ